MAFFPVIALATALIAIGIGGRKQYFDERRRDRMARKVFLYLGIAILVVYLGIWFV